MQKERVETKNLLSLLHICCSVRMFSRGDTVFYFHFLFHNSIKNYGLFAFSIIKNKRFSFKKAFTEVKNGGEDIK